MELEKCRTPQKHGASLKTWYYIQEGPAGLQTPLNKEAGVRGLRRKVLSQNHVPKAKAVASLIYGLAVFHWFSWLC